MKERDDIRVKYKRGKIRNKLNFNKNLPDARQANYGQSTFTRRSAFAGLSVIGVGKRRVGGVGITKMLSMEWLT